MSDLQFSVFDHFDRNQRGLDRQFAERLEIVAAYDTAGFHGYHLAEHHSTPLGMAPSPGIFLAAVAQRTTRLRFGPLVYLLPLYHPLRLAEEIVMLDHLSGGRLDVGIGRGISPLEALVYGNDPSEGQARFEESLAVLKLAFTSERLTYNGEYYRFTDVPIIARPLQTPHPPLWYGVSSSPGSAERAAERGFNTVTLNVSRAPAIVREFEQSAQRVDRPELRIGLCRHVVVGRSDERARELASRAYAHWHESIGWLYHARGGSPVGGERPQFEEARSMGQVLVGSPETVASAVAGQLNASGARLFLGQFVFGDMRLDEALESIGLFAEHVIPAVRELARSAA